MRIFLNKTVWDASLERLNMLFDEFENICVGTSGGKDSTVAFEMTYRIAQERGREIYCFFLDQEAEYTWTADTIRQQMHREGVIPMWFQMPMRISNAASYGDQWLYCWEEGGEWVREKEPDSIQENTYGTKTFHTLFRSIPRIDFEGKDFAYVAGVRAQESPMRAHTLTDKPTYKWITWAKKLDAPDQYTFYPFYDWDWIDVWKAIHDNEWPYNRVYDLQYRRGVSIQDMRVSNLHHETAVKSLLTLQEYDPELYERLTNRLSGIDAVSKLENKAFYARHLPYMFRDWREYRDYLLDQLIQDKDIKAKFQRLFRNQEKKPGWSRSEKMLLKVHCNAIIANDYHGTKIRNAGMSAFLKYGDEEWARREEEKPWLTE